MLLAQAVTTLPPPTPTSVSLPTAQDVGRAMAGLWVLWGMVVVAYWLPTIVAAIRGVNLGRVAVLNFLLGFTVIGWVIALVLACRRKQVPRLAAY